MAVGQLITVQAVNFRVAQISQALQQAMTWAEELYQWQAGLTDLQIAALPAGTDGVTFSQQEANYIKGFANECHLLNQVRQGVMTVPVGGPPTAGNGYNFTSFFNIVIGTGV